MKKLDTVWTVCSMVTASFSASESYLACSSYFGVIGATGAFLNHGCFLALNTVMRFFISGFNMASIMLLAFLLKLLKFGKTDIVWTELVGDNY